MAFDEIYERYWSKLYAYAYNRLRDKETCEEIIQEVFVSLWVIAKRPKSKARFRAIFIKQLSFRC
jgi:RNA polymerase sigma-70 factor (ECF subfamily)